MVFLGVELGPLKLRNPLLSASGTFGHGAEMFGFVAPELLGGWVSKTVTRSPRPGNRSPRIFETEAGFLNSIGLENRGIEAYRRDVLPTMADLDTVVFTNVGGEREEEFAEVAGLLADEPAVGALEVNLSCPNVQGGRLPYATDPETARRVLQSVRDATSKPVFAKLSPNVTRIADMARAAEDGGAHGITAVNTVLGMAVDWRARRPRLDTVQGGYSGVAIKPIALRAAFECARAVEIPIIGCGGIRSAEDVLEFLIAGCSAVQVGTASFSDPALLGRLPARLSELAGELGVERLADLIGSLRESRGEASALEVVR